MGGLGSGDWANVSGRKDTVDLSRVLTIKILKEYGFFLKDKTDVVVWKNSAGDEVQRVQVASVLGGNGNTTPLLHVLYEVVLPGGVDKRCEYDVKLNTSPCTYGGFRWWFECPVVKDGVYCGNRCAKLYLPPGQLYFGCRSCYDLTYESCQTSHKYDNLDEHLQNMDIDSLSVTQALRLGGL
jgi:hypothetical protein